MTSETEGSARSWQIAKREAEKETEARASLLRRDDELATAARLRVAAPALRDALREIIRDAENELESGGRICFDLARAKAVMEGAE